MSPPAQQRAERFGSSDALGMPVARPAAARDGAARHPYHRGAESMHRWPPFNIDTGVQDPLFKFYGVMAPGNKKSAGY